MAGFRVTGNRGLGAGRNTQRFIAAGRRSKHNPTCWKGSKVAYLHSVPSPSIVHEPLLG